MQHGKKTFLESALILAICTMLGILFEQYFSGYGIFAFLFCALLYLARTAYMYYFQLDRQHKERSWEILKAQEAWQSIYAHLHFSAPLPATSSFSIAPDFAQYLMRHIWQHKPVVVMELGCGFSTLVSAQCMKEYGINGHIYSYEGDVHFMEECAQWLQQLDLSSYVTLRHAPYTEQLISGTNRKYYTLHDIPGNIDLLVVDGPPKALAQHARFPALPLCLDALSVEGYILCDDAARDDMQATRDLWQSAYPTLQFTYIPLVRGAFLIRKK